MDIQKMIRDLWVQTAAQDAEGMRAFFTADAEILWHNTDERFTLEEYLTANCKYPGRWRGEVERVEQMGELVVSVARVWQADGSPSFHCTSFYRVKGEKIIRADEYWGDDGPAPEWRRELHIGRPIGGLPG